MRKDSNEPSSMRADKWLWVARFYKTRSLANTAINGGKVHVNGERVRPSRNLGPGDTLKIQKGPYTFFITVERISKQRRPAEETRTLYTESADSAQERLAVYKQRKLEGHSAKHRERRPDKRARRHIRQFRQQT